MAPFEGMSGALAPGLRLDNFFLVTGGRSLHIGAVGRVLLASEPHMREDGRERRQEDSAYGILVGCVLTF